MRTVSFWNFPNQGGSKKKDHSYKNKKNYTSNGEDGEREFNQNLSIHFQWQPRKKSYQSYARQTNIATYISVYSGLISKYLVGASLIGQLKI
jgi:hypothetical protein